MIPMMPHKRDPAITAGSSTPGTAKKGTRTPAPDSAFSNLSAWKRCTGAHVLLVLVVLPVVRKQPLGVQQSVEIVEPRIVRQHDNAQLRHKVHGEFELTSSPINRRYIDVIIFGLEF